MDWEELQQAANELAEEAISEASVHGAKEAGLDRRACTRLYRGPDFLAIRKTDLGSMRYYGGFEDVAQERTMELGEFVFYSTDSGRVNSHWEQLELEPEAEPELCVHCNGSGEGQYDGTRCSYCGGRGSIETREE